MGGLSPMPFLVFGLREAALASVVFAAVWVLTRLARRRRAALHVALWSLVLVRLVLPTGLSAPWSPARLTGSWLAPSGVTEIETGAIPSWLHFERLPSSMPAAPVSVASLPPLLFAAWLLVGLWLGGAVWRLGRVVTTRRRFRRLAGRAVPATDPHLTAALERWRGALGVRCPVRLRITPEAAPPFTLGCLRPVVVLPEGLLAGGWRQAEAALAHELAHVARWDDLAVVLQAVIESTWFFHPLARLAGRELAAAREAACDERVLDAGGLTPVTYGRGLLAALRLSRREVAAVAALGHPERSLRMRLSRIVRHRPTDRLRPLPLALAVTAAAALLLPLAGRAALPDDAVPGGAAAKPVAAPAAVQLANPIPGARVTSPFGPRLDPLATGAAPAGPGGAPTQHHDGIDLGSSHDPRVYAPADGTVVEATTADPDHPRLGTVLRIDHGGGLETFYAHLDKLAVKAGQHVSRGDLLGRAGSTGAVTGPHLHFEVHVDGRPVDPAGYVADWR